MAMTIANILSPEPLHVYSEVSPTEFKETDFQLSMCRIVALVIQLIIFLKQPGVDGGSTEWKLTWFAQLRISNRNPGRGKQQPPKHPSRLENFRQKRKILHYNAVLNFQWPRIKAWAVQGNNQVEGLIINTPLFLQKQLWKVTIFCQVHPFISLVISAKNVRNI